MSAWEVDYHMRQSQNKKRFSVIMASLFIACILNYLSGDKWHSYKSAEAHVTSGEIVKAEPLSEREMWASKTFGDFTDKLFALPIAEQTRVWDYALDGMTVTWTGIAISDDTFVRKDMYVKGSSEVSFTGRKRGYVVSVRGDFKDFKVGEEVTVTGKLETRGFVDEANKQYGKWKIYK
jgi:hypothetical protein